MKGFIIYSGMKMLLENLFFFKKRKYIRNINIGPIFSVRIKPSNCIISKFYLKTVMTWGESPDKVEAQLLHL